MEHLLYIFIVYLSVYLLLQTGIYRKSPICKHDPPVSILIAARNEEHSIRTALESILKLNYPKSLLDVIIINDHSTDRTYAYAKEYAEQYAHISVMNISADSDGLTGKMNALAQGIQQATGDIILITDADCLVPPDWVENYIHFFIPEVGMVGGLTILESKGFFAKVQALDWIFLQTIASGTAGIGLPVTILGNNFAFRKNVYLEVGGFAKIGFSVTEDMALMQAISRKTKWKILYPLVKHTAIKSVPAPSIKSFYQQRKRWIIGGRKVSWWGYFLMFSAFSAHLLMLLVWPLNLISTLSITLLSLCLLADFLLLYTILARIKQKQLLVLFIAFELFYIFYTLTLALLFIVPATVNWKGRKFD
jgi:cellulose synthase/poly-beta-1,6-N-acetylglucosamine synthase-like glycosyltransferase